MFKIQGDQLKEATIGISESIDFTANFKLATLPYLLCLLELRR